MHYLMYRVSVWEDAFLVFMCSLGIAIKLLDRMAIGFVVASASFYMSAWVQSVIDSKLAINEKVHIGLQVK